MKTIQKCIAIFLAAGLVFCLSACGTQDKAETTDAAAAQENETRAAAAQEDEAQAATQPEKTELEWGSYHLTADEIRFYDEELDGEIDLSEVPDGEKYLVAKVRCGETEEIPSDDLSGLYDIYLKTSSGDEYEAENISQSGIGAIRNDVLYVTSGITLTFFYLVPQGTSLSGLTMFVKDAE